MTTIQTPDGVLHQFPDGMSRVAIDHAMQAYVAAHAPAKDVGEDVRRAIPTGLKEGVAGFVGTLGDIVNAPHALGGMVDRFAQRHGVDLEHGAPTPFMPGMSFGGVDLPKAIATAVSKRTGLDPRLARLAQAVMVPGLGMSGAPTSSESMGAITNDQPQYQPTTTAGRYARTIAAMAPAALTPGGPVRRIASVVVPGVASEAAGQLTHEHAPDLEPYARVAGALLGSTAVQMVAAPPPSQQLLARAARGATDEQIAAATDRMTNAADQGVRLTMPEALQQETGGGTGLGRLQRVVEGTRAGNERFAPVMAERPAQVRQAVTDFADTIAPPTDQPSMVGAGARQAADSGLNTVRRYINSVAEPNYEALAGQRLSDADMARMAANPSYREALAGLRAHPELGAQVANLPDSNLAVVNEVVKRLNTGAEQARPGPMNPMGDNGLAALRDQGAGVAQEIAGAASPEWRAAREGVAAGRQAYLEPLQRGPLGAIAGTDSLKTQTGALFPAQPAEGAASETAAAMRMLGSQDVNVGPALTRQHLVTALHEATQDTQGGANQWGGAKYAATIAGNPEQERALLAGVGAAGGDTGRLSSLIETLRATGKRQPAGSMTAFNASDLEAMRKAGVVGDVAEAAADPLGIFGRARRAVGDFMAERNAGRLAEAMLANPAQAQDILMHARQVVPPGAALDTIERLAVTAQQARQPQLEAAR